MNGTDTDKSEEPILSQVATVSLVVTAIYAVLGVLVAHWFRKSLSRVDYWVTVWLVYDILIHLTLEAPFVVISLLGTVQDSDHFLSLTWKEYAKADIRWGVSDPVIVSLEFLTVTVVECFAVVTLYGILKNKFFRHFAQIVLCVSELYGGWMTFCPEWLTGSNNLVTNSFLLLWVYLVFFNVLWVVFPVLMLWQSWEAMKLSYTYEEKDGYTVKVMEETTKTTSTYHYLKTGKKVD